MYNPPRLSIIEIGPESKNWGHENSEKLGGVTLKLSLMGDACGPWLRKIEVACL